MKHQFDFLIIGGGVAGVIIATLALLVIIQQRWKMDYTQ